MNLACDIDRDILSYRHAAYSRIRITGKYKILRRSGAQSTFNMKLVIGLAGLPLSGKETVATRIEASFKADGFSVSRHRFSDVLRDTLDLWGMSHGRANEQILAQIMQRPGAFPEGVLSRAVKHRM